MLQAWLFRGPVDLGRPSDISLYHLGCFQLVLPSSRAIPLAAVVLSSLQQAQQQQHIGEVLEAFREAGAVLEIRAPKCKQSESKRKLLGGHSIDWLDLRETILDPTLAVLCPTRTLAFCMLTSWWARGAISARLLGVRRFGSTAKAASKRHQQPDYQAHLPPGAAKVPTAGDVHSYIPSLYLLQKQQQPSSSGTEDDSAASDAVSSGDEDAAEGSSSSSAATVSQAEAWLAHTKPRAGAGARQLLKLWQLSGYYQRHSLQVGERHT